MRKYFGTDGIRGVANDSLTASTAFDVGNALTSIKENPTVVIGKDTRTSGDMLSLAVATGVISGGGNVIFLDVITTPAIAYETRIQNADFGIVISASHNPAEYNGIKIFGSDGYKLSDETEELIESKMGAKNYVEPNEIGKIKYLNEPSKNYENYLQKSIDLSLDGLKIVFDGSNGAGYQIAPSVFSKKGAEVVAINCDRNATINDNCGCLFPHVVANAVVENKADIGIAIDGDGDRLIACDNEGNIVNGDMILFIIATYLKDKNLLEGNIAIGTLHTNMGIENALLEKGIKFMRSDIGDRYVIELMKKTGSCIGGEQSGHIIIGNKTTTGDGILTALFLCEIMKEENKSLKELCIAEQYPQENINIKVMDKKTVMEDKKLNERIALIQSQMAEKGRILVRASGTEPKIRIMVEHFDASMAKKIAEELANEVNIISNMEK